MQFAGQSCRLVLLLARAQQLLKLSVDSRGAAAEIVQGITSLPGGARSGGRVWQGHCGLHV